jgi:hypothetical protein
MVSEMKRINALNLEPALPKLDDKTRADWINFKQSQTRNQATKTPQACLKEEFKQSLDLLRKRENFAASSSTSIAERSGGDTPGHRWNSSAPTPLELGRSSEVSIPKASGSAAPVSDGTSIGALTPSADRKDGKSPSSFSFNANAKEFSFNPQASVFTPTNASAEQPPSFGMQGQQASAPSPKAQSSSSQFTCNVAKSNLLSKPLQSLLDPFMEFTLREPANIEPQWVEAVGPRANQVLGQPNPANPMPPVGAMPGGAVPPWQQGQQQAPGQLPQGVAPSQPQMNAMPSPQGFVVQQVPPPGGQPGQMFQQMYPAPQGNMSAQRPPQGGNMPMQGQPMVFNGQPMYGLQRQDGQTSMMPANMVVPQSGPMGAMPKFQGQVMVPMAPGGQFPQGFSPQQGQMQQGQMQQGQQQPPPQMGPQMMQQQPFVPSHQQGGKQGGKRS